MRNIFWLVVITLLGCMPKNLSKQYPSRIETATDRDKPVYSAQVFQSVPNDPLGVKITTLKNGLKVYLSVNKDEPRIQTLVTVKAGGKHDPSYATGLAHYLEHMLFKGTDRFGTVDYEKEKIELDKIKNLFEVLRSTKDSVKRKAIYHSIDSISQIASQYACLNEFDQMHTMLGAKGTNAYTTHDNTSYITNIPTNQLKDWLKLEYERFRNPVLRLFHTELEAVYEEKNRSQDNHFRQAYYAMLRALFKKHNYGQQTTIGTIEHLKNPSIVEIEKFYQNYYVPNNMAIILSGDFNPDSALAAIQSTFGLLEPAPFDNYVFEPEDLLDSNEIIRIQAPDAPSLLLAYRLPKANSKEVLLAEMFDMILNNSKAGLIDLNINQPQKAVGVYSGISAHADYSYHILGGSPTKGQTLEELNKLIIEQVNHVKKGEFPDWLISAIVNDFKIRELKKLHSNRNRVDLINKSFVQGIQWGNQVEKLQQLEQITKEDIVAFANSVWYKHYVVVYKEQTEEKLNRRKVEKPEITPLNIPQGNKSEFFSQFITSNSPKPIQPEFIDYANEIATSKLVNNSKLIYGKNSTDDLFSLTINYPLGAYHRGTIELAAKQVKLLGTNKYTANELSEEMYKIGMSYSFSIDQRETSLKLSGLTSQFDQCMSLLTHIVQNIQPDDSIFQALVQKTIQQRINETTNPKTILWKGLMNYAVYGKNSPLNDELSNDELLQLKSDALIKEFNKMLGLKPVVLYYGGLSQDEVIQKLNASFIVNGKENYNNEIEYDRLGQAKNKFILVDYDLKQSEILFLNKGDLFNKNKLAVNKLFNQYYGGGMSSVVFQEIREKKALAYQAFAIHTNAKDTINPQYTYGYIGCQTDKTTEAIESMLSLFQRMPENEEKFNQAKSSIIQNLVSTRVNRAGKLVSYWNDMKLGVLPKNSNETIYNTIQNISFDDVLEFHKQNISGKQFTIVIISNLSELNISELKKIGEVEIVEVKDLFPY